MGAEVTTVPVYRNETPEYSEQAVDAVFGGNPDLVTFTSSSTVSNLVNILKKSKKECYLNSIKGASIGPVTSETAGKLGITIAVNAGEHTIPGLVDSILEYFAGDPK
jgi:uroporphyrinogen III methyltransferase/synthase